MPKQVPEAVFEAVVKAVARLPDGGPVSRIGEALGEVVPRRTLQRRLAALVAQGRLVREGQLVANLPFIRISLASISEFRLFLVVFAEHCYQENHGYNCYCRNKLHSRREYCHI